MAEIFLAGVLVSFVKLMAYGDIGVGLSFVPWCMFCLLQLRRCSAWTAAGCGTILPRCRR
jgi:uncharacterized paraquat-inducible protein A